MDVYKHVIVNDDVEEAANQFIAIMKKAHKAINKDEENDLEREGGV